jgi:serine phosphatase RsbU (regulator of sigma subunit)
MPPTDARSSSEPGNMGQMAYAGDQQGRGRAGQLWDRLGSVPVLIVLSIAVLIGLVAALLLVVRDASDEADRAEDSEQVAELTDVTIDLVLALQVERGFSGGYLAADGDEYWGNVVESRTTTDTALAQAALVWGGVRGDFTDEERDRLDPAFDLDTTLDELRGDVDEGPVPQEEFERINTVFAGLISQLTTAVSAMGASQSQAFDGAGQVALAHVLRAMRAAGNERTLLLTILTSNERLTDDEVDALIARRTLISDSLEQFTAVADSNQLTQYQAYLDDPSVVATDETIAAVLADAETGNYEIDPQAAFSAATERVDVLADLARSINEDLLTVASDRADEAQLTARVLTGAVIVILALAALFGLAAAASARQRQRAEREVRGIAETLQRSLLPNQVPAVDGVTVLTRYEASAEYARVGGDWYDAVPLPDGRLGIMIGDVVGHGIQAAAIMGELRHTLRATAYQDLPPDAVLDTLAQQLREVHVDEEAMATAAYAVLDPNAGTLCYSSAGHPPLLVRDPDGTVRHLDGARSVLLGTHLIGTYTTEQVDLAPGAIVLLYTDGLVERAGEVIDVAIDRLAAQLAAPADDLAALAQRLYDAQVDHGPVRDDLAIMLVRYDRVPSLDGVRRRSSARVSSDLAAEVDEYPANQP